jgi:hypothetical protein
MRLPPGAIGSALGQPLRRPRRRCVCMVSHACIRPFRPPKRIPRYVRWACSGYFLVPAFPKPAPLLRFQRLGSSIQSHGHACAGIGGLSSGAKPGVSLGDRQESELGGDCLVPSPPVHWRMGADKARSWSPGRGERTEGGIRFQGPLPHSRSAQFAPRPHHPRSPWPLRPAGRCSCAHAPRLEEDTTLRAGQQARSIAERQW